MSKSHASTIDRARESRKERQARMVALLKRLAPEEGYTLTALPDVRFLRADRPLASTPVLYEPGIVIVCQGRKRGLWAHRLHQARLLMLRSGKTASAASIEVGYESASQFSREFKRFFGLSPGDEVARLKSSFAMPPLPGQQGWVTSH